MILRHLSAVLTVAVILFGVFLVGTLSNLS